MKKKHSKKTKSKNLKPEIKAKLPSNSRIITELRNHFIQNSKIWIGGLYIVLCVGIGIVGVWAYQDFQALQKLEQRHKELEYKINYWNNVVAEHQDYRDAYFQIAWYEYQMGNSKKAKESLEKVFEIDPNYEVGRKLESLLNK